ncbi:MAG: hypothetical protein HOL40_03305, partial [Cellvibrionales bacterium]|nr:hypothetical protein [Cellvibrionales bacterium]
MYVQDLTSAHRSLDHGHSLQNDHPKQKKLLSISGFTLLFLISLLHSLFSFSAQATQNNPIISSAPEANLFSSSLVLQLNKKNIQSILLESYLEKNFTGRSPSLEEAENQHSKFWQPLAGQSKAIIGNKKPHWFRLQIHNPSNHTKNYTFTIAPTRGLYVKSVTLPHEHTEKIESSVLSDNALEMKNIFDRKINHIRKAA